MSAVAEKTQYTPEDLLTMPDGDSYELVAGNLVERNMSTRSSFVAGVTFYLLYDYNRANPRGWVFPEGTSYQCFPDAPRHVRRPDTSFVRFGRFPGEELTDGHILIAPDLVVEVVSPNDRVFEVDEKVEELLGAGTQLVWVVNPETRTVQVHRADATGVILRGEADLTGEEVISGFRCKVADLFRSLTPAAPAP